MYKILILNLGDTSTKLSVFQDETILFEETIRHDEEEIIKASTMGAQLDLRKKCIQEYLENAGLSLDGIDAAVIRTTIYICFQSGTYLVNDVIRADINKYFDRDRKLNHAGNVTLPLLDELLAGRDIPIYLVDPISVDEFEDVARISGHPLVRRISLFHALNHKAVARKASAELGKKYEETRLVVAHMGGGVSIGAHKYGRVVDNAGGQGTEGPFCSNRCGSVLVNDVIDLCYSGQYSRQEMDYLLLKKGGFVGYLGIGDMLSIQKMVEDGDKKADLVFRAFIYQICKEIAAQAAVLCCDVDAIVLTGGIAHSEMVVSGIREQVGKLAPIMVYPGEMELEAMIAGVLRVLRGAEEAIIL